MTREHYVEAIRALAITMADWVAEHPGCEIKIQINAPRNIGVIMILADADENKFLSLSDDARQMLTETGALRDGQNPPTVNMLIGALALFEQALIARKVGVR